MIDYSHRKVQLTMPVKHWYTSDPGLSEKPSRHDSPLVLRCTIHRQWLTANTLLLGIKRYCTDGNEYGRVNRWTVRRWWPISYQDHGCDTEKTKGKGKQSIIPCVCRSGWRADLVIRLVLTVYWTMRDIKDLVLDSKSAHRGRWTKVSVLLESSWTRV